MLFSLNTRVPVVYPHPHPPKTRTRSTGTGFEGVRVRVESGVRGYYPCGSLGEAGMFCAICTVLCRSVPIINNIYPYF